MLSMTAIDVGATLASAPVVLGDELYFAATDSAHGTQLWKSDGTAEGTVMLTDLADQSGGLNPSDLTVVGKTLYFTAYDGQASAQLWESDGTVSGTTVIAANGSSGGRYPSDLVDVEGTLYFVGSDGSAGYQVFRSDGTTAGTVPVTSLGGGGNVSHLTGVGFTLYFEAYDRAGRWLPALDSGYHRRGRYDAHGRQLDGKWLLPI